MYATVKTTPLENYRGVCIMKEIETYFFVVYKVNKEAHECGPYDSLAKATEMLVDHIPFLASKQSVKTKYNFKAEIQERILDTASGTWLTISTPLMENPCRKQKLRQTVRKTGA